MSERVPSRWFVVVLVLAVAIPFAARPGGQARTSADRCLVPASIREPILNEVSGEQASLHVQFLAANRDRQAAEYQNQYFETTYIRDMAKQYGLSDVQVDFFPTRDTWDAEEGDLWLVQPRKEKIASITMVPTALAQGSKTADVEAEVVYVGLGREADYAGKDVKGKIVLGSGSFRDSFTGALQRGAVGALGTGSPGINGDAAGATLDQIGWASVSPASGPRRLRVRPVAAAVPRSARPARARPEGRDAGARPHADVPGEDERRVGRDSRHRPERRRADPRRARLRDHRDAGRQRQLHRRGHDPRGRPHARPADQGRHLPQPRRTIRFLWVPEISGSTAFMFKHPELQDKLLVALNFDMTGANPKTTDSYLRMKMTPDSRPSYLNDLIASLLQFVDQTKIRTQQGQNAQFNYRLSPVAAITSGSDHSVFNDGGVPAMQFNYWPDNFYHSSEDRIVYVDPTELKRVGFMAASAFYYLATAGPDQARDLAWEATANGEKWMAEVTRQSVRLLGDDAAKLADQFKAVQMKVTGAFEPREGRRRVGAEAVEGRRRGRHGASACLRRSTPRATRTRSCWNRGTPTRPPRSASKPVPVTLTDKEREYSVLIPRRLFKVYSEEARSAPGARAAAGRGGQRGAPGTPAPRRLPGPGVARGHQLHRRHAQRPRHLQRRPGRVRQPRRRQQRHQVRLCPVARARRTWTSIWSMRRSRRCRRTGRSRSSRLEPKPAPGRKAKK